MRGRTFALSQEELQRVSVISSYAKGDMAWGGGPPVPRRPHANRGRPSPRRLPARVRQAVVRLARSTYAGFNDHHLCEKLCEVEGFSLSRETLRRLLREAGLGSPRKRRAPAHRQRRLRSAREGELVQLDGSPHDWLEGRGPRLTALGLQDDATGKILAAQFFPSESAAGYLALLRQLLRNRGVPLAFYGDHSGIFVRNDDFWSVEEQLAGKRQPTQFGRALQQLGITFIAARSPQAKGRRRTRLGRASGSSVQRVAPGSSWPSGFRQRRAARIRRRLQPPLRPPSPSSPNRMASGTRKS